MEIDDRGRSHVQGAGNRISLVLLCAATAGALTGCTIDLGQNPEVKTTENLRITAEQIRHFDSYCGIGVRIENVSSTTIAFTPDDLSVFDGAGSIEWDLPFGGPPGSVTKEHQGYAIGEFPTVLEPGATATDAFVVPCKEGGGFTINVVSLDGDNATFKFPG